MTGISQFSPLNKLMRAGWSINTCYRLGHSGTDPTYCASVQAERPKFTWKYPSTLGNKRTQPKTEKVIWECTSLHTDCIMYVWAEQCKCLTISGEKKYYICSPALVQRHIKRSACIPYTILYTTRVARIQTQLCNRLPLRHTLEHRDRGRRLHAYSVTVFSSQILCLSVLEEILNVKDKISHNYCKSISI